MAKLKGNAVIGQSGGPTVVINQSLVGVIKAAKEREEIGKIYGARHGVRGMLEENFIELQGLSPRQLDTVAQTPSAALGSTRDKPDEEYCERLFEVFRRNEIHYFFYIGGNDSASTAHILNSLSNKVGYDLRAIHVPKTIDNDLPVTDHCPGYGSAARFVALAMMGDNLDNKALPGVKIDIIMGRHTGWLSAASILARQEPDDGPHLIYVPEVPVEMSKFVEDVDQVVKTHGRCLVAVSEGISDSQGELWAKKATAIMEQDAHGNVTLSGTGVLADFLISEIRKSKPNIKRMRGDTFGYLQRCFPGVVSKIDAQEAYMVGQEAVRYATDWGMDGSVAIRRLGGSSGEYKTETFLTPLASVAAKTKTMPAEFCDTAGVIKEAFLDYVRPLVGELPSCGRL